MDVRVGLWRRLSTEELCFWTVVLEKTLESPLDCKEIQPVHSEGDQPWDFFGRNDAKAETPKFWPSHVKSWLIGKDSDAGRDWGQEEKGTTDDEMAGWHHWLDGHESEWTPRVGDGQGGLAVLGGIPRWLSGKESACQSGRPGFDLWVEEDPWRRKCQPTPLFLPGKSRDRGAWRAAACGVTRVGQDLATKEQLVQVMVI